MKAISPLGYGLYIAVLAIAVGLVGCTTGVRVQEPVGKWKRTADGYTMAQEEFLGHTYIAVTRGGLLHDPDCKCGRG
jgi:hypothetical protein